MLNISPSKVARYFYHDCERYLIYVSTPKHEKLQKGIYIPEFKPATVTGAVLDAGYKWEEEVVNKIKNNTHISDTQGHNGKLHERVYDESNTISVLKKISDGEYLYQGCLKPP